MDSQLVLVLVVLAITVIIAASLIVVGWKVVPLLQRQRDEAPEEIDRAAAVAAWFKVYEDRFTNLDTQYRALSASYADLYRVYAGLDRENRNLRRNISLLEAHLDYVYRAIRELNNGAALVELVSAHRPKLDGTNGNSEPERPSS